MATKPFTRNFADNSTEAGFQFTFYCDLCEDGFKTQFEESTTYSKSRKLKGLLRGASMAASLLGKHNLEYNIGRGGDIIGERFDGMSPEWHREHEAAFERAQNEAKRRFQRCHKCHRWVCEQDWNEQEGLCVDCAPRRDVEIVAARAGKMVDDIRAKAQETVVFDGKIESKQTFCPECGKAVSEGKFCTNCGASLTLTKCPQCGAKHSAGTRFCGECGERM